MGIVIEKIDLSLLDSPLILTDFVTVKTSLLFFSFSGTVFVFRSLPIFALCLSFPMGDLVGVIVGSGVKVEVGV